jgi:crotonobetainyl-CoA:carnitine CoA-transferase CaiB-like acyl-CoA transferase
VLPLSGIRVIETPSGPISGLGTMILADFGAEVIRIEPPGGDPEAGQPSARLWRRGKTVIELDLEDQRAVSATRELIVDTAEAAVLTPALRTRLALEKNGRPIRQDLILAILAGIGESGRYVDYPAKEGLVAALSGRMMTFEGAAGRGGPVFSALQVGVHATAQSLAAGLLSSLHARTIRGRGAVFTTSLLRGMLPYDLSGLQTEQLVAKGLLERAGGRQDVLKVMPRIYYHAARTRDGRWIQFGNLLPHLQQNFFRAAEFDVGEGGVPESGPELEAFRNRMLEHIATRDLDEWMEVFVDDGGVVAHPYQTTQQALDDPDLVDNGHVVETPNGRQLGVLANLLRTPGRVGGLPEVATLDGLKSRRVSAVANDSGGEQDDEALPLSGVTVVEAATIIAAPLGASTLADLGARVIKLEPLAGDPFRQMIGGIGASKCNTGKESVCVDLKQPRGQKIAQELIRSADIFIHNYRPGVPERLGLGYESLSQTNPGLIYLSANGYGPAGPGAHRPSTHPIPGAALGGVVWQMGQLPDAGPMSLEEVREVTRKLFRANEVNPDPNTSMVIATTATLGLLARDRTGHGQKILVDMFGANAYANWDDFLSYPDKPDRPSVDAEGFGLAAGYRLYRCTDGWIFLYAADESQLASLGSSDPEALEALFLSRGVDDWTQTLTSPELCCVRADAGWPADFLLGSDLAREEELVVTARHPEWGEYLRHGPMVRFGAGRDYPDASMPGDGTEKLLAELGYSTVEIAELIDEAVVAGYSVAASR